MHYEVEVVPGAGAVTDGPAGLRPAAVRVLAILDASGEWETVRTIGDGLAGDSTGQKVLRARTIQDALAALVAEGLADAAGGRGSSGGRWRSVRAQSIDIEVKNAS
jgi:hypothetical protein